MNINNVSNYRSMRLDYPVDEVINPTNKKTHKSMEFLKPPSSSNVNGYRWCGVDVVNTATGVKKNQDAELINKPDSLISRIFRWAGLSVGIY